MLMAEEFMNLEQEEGKEWVQRYEQMIAVGENPFLDITAFEFIIEHYVENGDFDNAMKACNIAREQYPFSPELGFEHAQLLVDIGKLQEALEEVNTLESYQTTDPDVILLKTSVLGQLRRYEEALEYLKARMVFVDEKDRAYFAIALNYEAQGNYTEAADYFRQTLELNADSEPALNELSYCYEVLDLWEEAIEYLQEYTDKNPYSAVGWFQLGAFYNRDENYEKAQDALEYATALDDKNIEAYFCMGHVHMNCHRYDEAIKSYEYAASLDAQPSVPLLVHIGSAHERKGVLDKAIQFYRQATHIDPRYADAWYGMGSCMLVQEKYLEAVHFLRKATDIDMDSDQYWLGLARAEYGMGNIDASHYAYNKVVNLNPLSYDAWVELSLFHYEQGEFEEAFDTVTTALTEMPEEAGFYYLATVYLLSYGKFKEALNYLQIGLDLNYDQHELLFKFFPSLEKKKAIFKLIEQFKIK